MMPMRFEEMFAGARVLVTGATGLIGSAVVERLVRMRGGGEGPVVCAAGRSVEKLQRRFHGLAGARLRFAQYDAAQPLRLGFEADYIVHAACSAHPMAYSTDPVGVMQANLLGTMNLLESMRARPGSKLVFLSTGEIYGDDPQLESGFSEEDQGYIDILSPRACYPESKRAAETMIASYHAQYGVDARVARLCHVYGPGITPSNSRADAQFLRRALASEPIVMKSAGAQVRSFCYVEDAVDALFVILQSGEAGRAYNVANRASTASVREYAETLARIAGVELAFELPPDAERAGYTRVSRAVLDPSRLEALGWRPGFDLESGLRETLQEARAAGDA